MPENSSSSGEQYNTTDFSTVVSLSREAESLLLRQAKSPVDQVQRAFLVGIAPTKFLPRVQVRMRINDLQIGVRVFLTKRAQ